MDVGRTEPNVDEQREEGNTIPEGQLVTELRSRAVARPEFLSKRRIDIINAAGLDPSSDNSSSEHEMDDEQEPGTSGTTDVIVIDDQEQQGSGTTTEGSSGTTMDALAQMMRDMMNSHAALSIKLSNDNTALSTKMSNEISTLRTDLTKDNTALRTDLTKDNATLRIDMMKNISTLRTDLTNDNTALSTKMSNEISTLRTDMTSSHTALKDELTSIRTEISGLTQSYESLNSELATMKVNVDGIALRQSNHIENQMEANQTVSARLDSLSANQELCTQEIARVRLNNNEIEQNLQKYCSNFEKNTVESITEKLTVLEVSSNNKIDSRVNELEKCLGNATDLSKNLEEKAIAVEKMLTSQRVRLSEGVSHPGPSGLTVSSGADIGSDSNVNQVNGNVEPSILDNVRSSVRMDLLGNSLVGMQVPINDNAIGKFNGRDKNPKEFLRSLKLMLEQRGLLKPSSWNIAQLCIDCHLGGNAALWWKVVRDDVHNFVEFTKIFKIKWWNPQLQMVARGTIEFGKYDAKEWSSMSAYFLSKVIIARNLEPCMTEPDIVSKLTYHFPDFVVQTVVMQNITTISHMERALDSFDRLKPVINKNKDMFNPSESKDDRYKNFNAEGRQSGDAPMTSRGRVLDHRYVPYDHREDRRRGVPYGNRERRRYDNRPWHRNVQGGNFPDQSNDFRQNRRDNNDPWGGIPHDKGRQGDGRQDVRRDLEVQAIEVVQAGDVGEDTCAARSNLDQVLN